MSELEYSYCRLCAKSKPLDKLTNLEIEHSLCEDIISRLTRLNCELDLIDDKLPKMVCLICINSLQNAFTFISDIEKAQTVLNEIICTQTIKTEIEDCNDDSQDLDYNPNDLKSDSSAAEDLIELDPDLKTSPIIEDPLSDKADVLKSDSSAAEDIIELDPDLKTSPVIEDTLSDKAVYDLPRKTSPCQKNPLNSATELTWEHYNWKCKYCETEFPTITELKSHSMKYHSACNAFACTMCKLWTGSLARLLCHYWTHNKNLATSCYLCYRTFPSLLECQKHIRTHRTSKFKCRGCHSCFPNKEECVKHSSMFFKNINFRPSELQKSDLTCAQCNKKYKCWKSLNNHNMLIHSRRRDYVCDICGKDYLRKRELTLHLERHEDIRPFQCKICKLSFRTKCNLRFHISVHDKEKRFSCDVCSKRFRLEEQLKTHSVIHTDTRPYACTNCDKRFNFKTLLTQHLRLHTGEMPYSCNICQREFRNCSNRTKHMKRIHGIDTAKKRTDTIKVNNQTKDQVINEDKTKVSQHRKQRKSKRKRTESSSESDS